MKNKEKYNSYFDYNRLSYREWGIHELLTQEKGYKVKSNSLSGYEYESSSA